MWNPSGIPHGRKLAVLKTQVESVDEAGDIVV